MPIYDALPSWLCAASLQQHTYGCVAVRSVDGSCFGHVPELVFSHQYITNSISARAFQFFDIFEQLDHWRPTEFHCNSNIYWTPARCLLSTLTTLSATVKFVHAFNFARYTSTTHEPLDGILQQVPEATARFARSLRQPAHDQTKPDYRMEGQRWLIHGNSGDPVESQESRHLSTCMEGSSCNTFLVSTPELRHLRRCNARTAAYILLVECPSSGTFVVGMPEQRQFLRMSKQRHASRLECPSSDTFNLRIRHSTHYK